MDPEGSLELLHYSASLNYDGYSQSNRHASTLEVLFTSALSKHIPTALPTE
jgi:hypothetical protein